MIGVVEANRVRKSVGAETSYAQDLSDQAVMLHELETIAETVHQRLERHQAGGTDDHVESEVCGLSTDYAQPDGDEVDQGSGDDRFPVSGVV